MTTDTTPIPHGRYAAPDPAPNRPTEGPRCGAPAISRHGVALHDLDHRRRDTLEKRQERVLEALEGMLATFDGDPGEEGDEEPKTFRAWVQETDHILDTLTGSLETLAGKVEELARIEHPAATLEAAEIEPLPWPGDAAPAPDEDETVEPDDSDVPNPAEPVLAAAPAPAPEDDDDFDDLDALPHPASRF